MIKYIKRWLNPDKVIRIEKVAKNHWCDKDEMLLQLGFQFLTKYAEKNYITHPELKNLLIWWTKERELRHDPTDDIPFPYKDIEDMLDNTVDTEETREWHKAVIKSGELENKWYKEDTEKLLRLATLRKYMGRKKNE